ncbi:MAG: hypothetical protein AVDCRST_MAG93-9335, partial [uncultured Chloroflexia bacterium]
MWLFRAGAVGLGCDAGRLECKPPSVMTGAANFDDSMVCERLVKVIEPVERPSGRPDDRYTKYR